MNGPRGRGAVDIGALRRDLKRSVRGEVRFDAGSRALYANDFSLYRHVPLGVVIPHGADDVEATVAACREHGAPVLPRGCGTGPSGQSVNVAVILDYTKAMNEIVAIDPERREARVAPGVICDQLRDAAERHRLTFGPDPATHEYCTFGGMIGNNSCGSHSVMAGKTSDNVIELDVVTYDGLRLRVGETGDDELAAIIAAGGRRGEIYARLRELRDANAERIRAEFPDIPRRVSGYNLDELLPENGFHVARALVGSEGTCVNVVEAAVRLVDSPQGRVTVLLAYPDVVAAAAHVPEIMSHEPIALEGFDDLVTGSQARKRRLAREREQLPEAGAWLLAEFGADTTEDARELAAAAERALARDGRALSVRLLEAGAAADVWRVRTAAVGDSRIPYELETEGNWEDAAVHPDRLADYLRDFGELLDRHSYRCVYYGHFGQGCVHTRIDFDLKTVAGLRTFRSFMEEAADLVVSYGGSLAGEYGEGQGRAELLPRMFGPELTQAFRDFKAIWDPDGGMNPGKLVGDLRLDENLRAGPDQRLPQVSTYFSFERDQGSFANAVERCFGMAKCRTPAGVEMCPSFQVTREEKYTTRGRARLLFEMLKGEVITDGWRDDEVKDSLDLCLSCKGCRGECPVQVDIPTYKAEFLAHYYRRRLRPRSAYALGLFPLWARAAAHAPRLVNAVTGAPLLGSLVHRAAGIAPERELPKFAPATFRRWFSQREAGVSRRESEHPAGDRVLLWPDTFTNYFDPNIGRAAVRVLEAAGCSVELAPAGICCGRPFYDFGMLRLARRHLRAIVESLREPIAAGVPLVVLEPSCAAVFRDELLGMLPGDKDARRLSKQTVLLSELLIQRGWEPPQQDRAAIVQGHCHHRAIMRFENEVDLLERAGLDVELPDSSCCGMAGSFGFEPGRRYETSVALAERAIAPAVRASDPDALVIADGFSCREQIRQVAGRRALHLAEVLDQGIAGDA